MEDRGVHLPGQDPHDGKGGHVQADPRARLELLLLDPGPAPDDIPGPAAGLDDEVVGRQGLEDVPDDLPHGLQRGQLVLRLGVRRRQALHVQPLLLQLGVGLAVGLHLGAVLG